MLLLLIQFRLILKEAPLFHLFKDILASHMVHYQLRQELDMRLKDGILLHPVIPRLQLLLHLVVLLILRYMHNGRLIHIH